MGRKIRTRSYAKDMQDKVELFSVRELSKDDLHIRTPTHRAIEYTDANRNILINDLHYSINKTNGGIDTCITRKCSLENGDTESIVSFIGNTRELLLWPIFSIRQGFCLPGRLANREKDKVVKIGEFHHHFTTMIYSVFVTHSGLELDMVGENFDFHLFKFRYFQLFILVSYIDRPTMRASRSSMPTTSPMIRNEKAVDNWEQIDATSITGKEMLKYHIKQCDDHTQDMKKSYSKEDTDYASLLSLCEQWFPVLRLKNRASVQFEKPNS